MAELDLIGLLRLSHVTVGALGLCVFWIPVLAAKGGRLHVRCGRLFTWCAYYGGATGLLFSCWAIAHPPSFFGDRKLAGISGDELPIAIANARFLYSITGFLAAAILAGTYVGVQVVKARRNHALLRRPRPLAAMMAYGMWSLALVGFGLWNLIACSAGSHPLAATGGDRYWIIIVLGAVGVYGAVSDLKYACREPASPMAWWYQHMECMLGAGIGFHAAAFFFIVKELLPIQLNGAWQLAPMLLPLAIGAPAMWAWIARYERKFESARTESV